MSARWNRAAIPSGLSLGPSRRRRCSSRSRSARISTCSLTTSSSRSRQLPGQPPVQVSGVVTNVEAVHEGARFASDVFLIAAGRAARRGRRGRRRSPSPGSSPRSTCRRMPGAVVSRATGKQRDSALYFDEMGDQKVPVGFGRDGQPVYINFEFVDGTRGAHVSISGVSGIATKTSRSRCSCCTRSSTPACSAGEAHNTKMLVFSVKGEDLLFLDYANSGLTPEQRKRYDELGLPAAPFQNVRVFAPPRPGDPAGTPDVHSAGQGGEPVLLDAGGVLRARSCCRSCSPTPRTSGPSTRC